MPASDPQRLALPVASDDADGKAILAGVIDELGFDPVDNGALAEAGRRQQPGSPVYNVPLTAGGVRERLGAMA